MRLLLALSLAALTGCTVIDTATVPSDRSGKDLFVTAGDIPEPYESLGMVQATRSGVLLFGFADVVGTDIQAGLEEVLIPQIARDGRRRRHQRALPPDAVPAGDRRCWGPSSSSSPCPAA